MQTEQQSTSQNKKSTLPKKEKKNTKKSELVEDLSSTVVENNSSAVIEDKSSSVQEPEKIELKETEEVITQTQDIEIIKDFDNDVSKLLDFLNNTNDQLNEYSKVFKDNVFTKDERGKVEVSFKKFNKTYLQFQTSYTEYLTRQVSILEKNSGNKSATKKHTDKEKSAIHKKLVVQPFLLKFMKLEPGVSVSRSDALTAITGYVKEEKVNNPDIIVNNDKRSFNIIGDLKPLFDGIKQVMDNKGLVSELPTQIKYTEIMRYMTHCFIKNDDISV
jgi:hypothetical protein